ncbi:MAG: hypothetical protein AAB518_02535 [Patescibacteria group bacterium]
MTSSEHKESILKVIEGRKLMHITFIGDKNGYVIFNFDGPSLQAYTPPKIKSGKTAFRLGESGYYDSLCSQITKTVKAISEELEKITIEFEDKTQIEISLKDEDSVCAESAMFNVNMGSKEWMVWRPGDEELSFSKD